MKPAAPKAPQGRPITLKAPYGDLARALGGLRACSEVLGVSPRTIRDWSRGRTAPAGPALLLLNRVLVENGMKPLR